MQFTAVFYLYLSWMDPRALPTRYGALKTLDYCHGARNAQHLLWSVASMSQHKRRPTRKPFLTASRCLLDLRHCPPGCRRKNSTQAYFANPSTYNNGQGCMTPCAKPDSDKNGCCDGVWLPSLNFMNTYGLPQVCTGTRVMPCAIDGRSMQMLWL